MIRIYSTWELTHCSVGTIFDVDPENQNRKKCLYHLFKVVLRNQPVERLIILEKNYIYLLTSIQ